jgi:hypothetical protein
MTGVVHHLPPISLRVVAPTWTLMPMLQTKGRCETQMLVVYHLPLGSCRLAAPTETLMPTKQAKRQIKMLVAFHQQQISFRCAMPVNARQMLMEA